MISLPEQAVELWGIREQDFLECSLTRAGILFTPIVPAESMAGPKKLGHGVDRTESAGAFAWQTVCLLCRKRQSAKESLIQQEIERIPITFQSVYTNFPNNCATLVSSDRKRSCKNCLKK